MSQSALEATTMSSSDDSEQDSDNDNEIYSLAHRTGPFRLPAKDLASRAYVKRMERHKNEWLRFCKKFKIAADNRDEPFRTPPNLN
ncbi:hypothetical protein LTR56_008336 [Elasticomyces elasticus]|nr:hypothetical protein LTR56_008336 [Elasticomyces elasticus]KAK3661472.1 hypothetical protein LTR22_007482 [Elasticomyces elasticus]KAK4926171.1 hypothetical protein LTR49_006875 [Elasticomyces elasticus]KAK5756893.1 hypothetical protein LTS12_012972 [Elasticomyces elasticus]